MVAALRDSRDTDADSLWNVVRGFVEPFSSIAAALDCWAASDFLHQDSDVAASVVARCYSEFFSFSCKESPLNRDDLCSFVPKLVPFPSPCGTASGVVVASETPDRDWLSRHNLSECSILLGTFPNLPVDMELACAGVWISLPDAPLSVMPDGMPAPATVRATRRFCSWLRLHMDWMVFVLQRAYIGVPVHIKLPAHLASGLPWLQWARRCQDLGDGRAVFSLGFT